MITITERKIAGLIPRWAPFAGFSLLFDNPGRSLRQDGDLETVACDVEGDPELEFYRRLHRGFAMLRPDVLLQSYGLCPLPTASYHVTAYDVANVGDLAYSRPEALSGLRTLLDGVPRGVWSSDDPILAPALANPVATQVWDLEFIYDRLWTGGHGVAVRLKPIDLNAFQGFVEARQALFAHYRGSFGFGASESYTPHVSLGYFMNLQGAELASARFDHWDAVLRETLDDASLTLKTTSLYAFTDMATFFRSAKQG